MYCWMAMLSRAELGTSSLSAPRGLGGSGNRMVIAGVLRTCGQHVTAARESQQFLTGSFSFSCLLRLFGGAIVCLAKPPPPAVQNHVHHQLMMMSAVLHNCLDKAKRITGPSLLTFIFCINATPGPASVSTLTQANSRRDLPTNCRARAL